MRSVMFRVALFISLLGLAGCGGNNSNPATPSSPNPTPGSSVSIVAGSSTMTTTAYNPNPITIQHGGSVTWVNNDTTGHTSTSDGGVWNSGTIAPGNSFSMSFPNAGSFPYHCLIHPNMVGTVTVQ
jgi:plastocyanin